MNIGKISSIIAAALIAAVPLAASADTTVKVGTVSEHNEAWDLVAKKLAPQGIKLEVVKFNEGFLPNRALQDGDLDLNAFQTAIFLENSNKEFGYKLVSIADTIISPLGLYSNKIKDVKELKEGDKIAVPSDATQLGRGLKLLEAAGLIKVDPKKGFLPMPRDITDNPLKLEIVQVDAPNTPKVLPDVAASVIDANYAVDAGFTPQKDAVYLEKFDASKGSPYVNVIAAREDRKDDKVFKEVVKAYQQKDVAETILKASKGAEIPVFKY
jgi:D-methionine transport system substrate-binding protein